MFQVVADEAGAKLVSKEDLAELKRLQSEWGKASRTAAGCGIDSAFNAYLDHQTKLALSVRAGKLHDNQARSREDFEEDYLRRGDAAKQVMRELTAEAVPLCRKVAEAFAKAAQDVIGRVEKMEADQFNKYGLSYQPSALVLALRRLPDMARARIPNGGYATVSPEQMLPFLVIN